MSLNEFEIIKRFFKRKTNSCYEVEKGIGDDCALINIPEKQTITISTDTLVSNVHFLLSINAADLGYKSLAINLSDLAAMGSNPAWLTLALTLPYVNENWLREFSDSLFEQINYYNIQLIGGDTTCGPLSITISIYGLVPLGCAIKRSGANKGDWIFVTGTLGDSAAGLSLLQNQHYVQDLTAHKMLVQRHLRPIPRLQQGQALRNLATSAIDISDGLISDISHVLDDSHVGACLYLESLPISPQLYNHFDPRQVLSWVLSGGEDYELCFTVPEVNRSVVEVLLGNFDVPYTCIGQITSEEEGLVLLKNGKPVNLSIYKGFDHFGKRYT